VARPSVVIRRVDKVGGDVVCELWRKAREAGEIGADNAGRKISDDSVLAALARPDTVAFIASSDATPVGYVVVSDCTLNPFSDSGCVAVEQLYVEPSARRQGVAKALMGAVATYADRHGADQVACNVPSQGKDANRFFARLGFAPHVVRRLTSTAALHRKLAGSVEGGRYSLEQVLVRRRAARVKAARQRLAAP